MDALRLRTLAPAWLLVAATATACLGLPALDADSDEAVMDESTAADTGAIRSRPRFATTCPGGGRSFDVRPGAPAGLVGRAVLPAATFAEGPPSGSIIGQNFPSQPVQGFSSLVDACDGSFWGLSDNGFGAIENSADYHLRIYRIRPRFETGRGGPGDVVVEEFIELRDPNRKVKFAITNHFSRERVLTGADFDIESLRVDRDGTLWIGDEFGPFLLHFDRDGILLDAPFALPDLDNPGQFVRAPQNPWLEEGSSVRVMNAIKAHARAHGALKTPVFSPWHVHLVDADATGNRGFNTQRDNFAAPNTPGPVGDTGLIAANDEFVRLAKSPGAFPNIQGAGYPVVTWTVNDPARMGELLALGVNGIISDRPDLLYAAVAAFDANADGTPGDYLDADGLIDGTKLDAQGHRGARNLRPENSVPAMEAALDHLMATLEMDIGLTRDDVPVLYHDRDFQGNLPGEPPKSRRKLGGDLPNRIRDATLASIQSATNPILNDGLIRGTPQTNDPAVSPVSVAYFTSLGRGAADIYMMPTLDQVFDFVAFYAAYYTTGAGASAPDAAKRAKNAARVRFNIETKLNPREPEVTKSPNRFVQAIGGRIVARGLADRADIQSFDFRTLLITHERFPSIRTVALFGDFSLCPTGLDGGGLTYCDDGTNLQPSNIEAPVTESLRDDNNTPWMAGLFWPYRRTTLDFKVRAASSGGFEGMAVSPDGRKLYPMLERPLAGDPSTRLFVYEFDADRERYTGVRYGYDLTPPGTNIGEFILDSRNEGIIIERDGTQGNVNGFKRLFRVTLPATPGGVLTKVDLVNLNAIPDPQGISLPPALPGDVGIGDPFSFPFTTIESVLVLRPDLLLVMNDNNYPFSIGRHVGAAQPDDNELILIKLGSGL
jgi:glycerophosphoryl diester phosphodiesterase